MNRRNLPLVFAFVFFSIPAFAHHLAVIAPRDNSATALTSAELARILKSQVRNWPDGGNVVVVIAKDSALTIQVLERTCNLSEAGVRAMIASHPGSFIQADSDAAVLAIVEAKPGALGIVDVHSIAGHHVRVLKVDGKLPMERGYLPH